MLGLVGEDAGFVMVAVPVAVVLEFEDKDEGLIVELESVVTKVPPPLPTAPSSGVTGLSTFAAAVLKASKV